jgi:4-amino-4-deoxy-L-arabinose transferase-like glycosyltransferase
MLRKIINNRHTPFWFISISVMIALTLPVLIQDGMFMDAMLYTSVSHNLSMGIGTFWFPKFSVYNIAGLSTFHEQPPLVFGIQALFFKLLGDSMYVERFYTFLTMLLGALLINVLWREIFGKSELLRNAGWLPVILWITIPVCFWSYSNNMHENTLTLFTLSAVIILYKSFQNQKFLLVYGMVAGVFVFFATLSKGIPGLFPVAVPVLYWMTTRKIDFKRAIIQTGIILIVPLAAYWVLFLLPESMDSLSIYLFKRALHRINEVPTVDSRFYIIGRLVSELLPQIIFVIIVWFVGRLKKIRPETPSQKGTALFFFSVGLASSLPLMLTMVQKGFYFVPSLPFFAIGFSLLIGHIIVSFIQRIDPAGFRFRLFLLASFLLLIAVIGLSWMQKGKASRNEELLHDVYLIGKVIPSRSTVSISNAMWNDWSLQCYLARYFNISLESGYKKEYCIMDKTLKSDPPKEYHMVNLPTKQYILYIRE